MNNFIYFSIHKLNITGCFFCKEEEFIESFVMRFNSATKETFNKKNIKLKNDKIYFLQLGKWIDLNDSYFSDFFSYDRPIRGTLKEVIEHFCTTSENKYGYFMVGMGDDQSKIEPINEVYIMDSGLERFGLAFDELRQMFELYKFGWTKWES